jgi:hypothetical protein
MIMRDKEVVGVFVCVFAASPTIRRGASLEDFV